MTEMNRDFKGVWIPKEIWLDSDLSALDKIIFTEISSLDDPEKGCWASNQYLADFCQCSESAVTKTISKLRTKGYLKITSFDGRTRIIRVVNFTRLPNKISEADAENFRPNNISNNKNNNINNIGEHNSPSHPQTLEEIREKTISKTKQNYNQQVDEVIAYMNEVLGTKYSSKTTTTINDLTAIFNKGYTVDQCKQVVDFKYDDWQGSEMEKYLRPSTLFRFSKFENYVNSIGSTRGNRRGVSRVPKRQTIDPDGGQRKIDDFDDGGDII